MPRIPVTDLHPQNEALRGELLRAVGAVVDKGDFVLGQPVDSFERAFAAWVGAPHAVGVANGTDALTLSLRGLGVAPGDEVIVPALTFIATAEAVLNAGGIPVFCDIRPDTLTIDPADVEQRMTDRTKGIVPVHLYGLPADMPSLLAIARERNLFVVEDAAQAHGASYAGVMVGTSADAGCFSFYPSKNLGALGDAGAVTTADPALAERVRRLGNHGSTGRYMHDEPGWNSRLDSLQAAALLVKLPHVRGWNSARRQRAERYRQHFADHEMIRLQSVPVDAVHVYHQFVIRVAREKRDGLRADLASKGIEARIHYPQPVHLSPAFSRRVDSSSLREAEAAATEVLSLPIWAELPLDQVDEVAERTIGYLSQNAN